jgi:hypothetical protein
MKPAKFDLPTIWRGCDWGPVTLKWKDKNGAPINLSGWQPKAQSLNINLNAVIMDALGGITQISLDRVQTANLRLGVEGWDWLWERTALPYRFPPFLAGKVPIKEPLSGTNGSHGVPPPGVAPPNDAFSSAITISGDVGSIDGTTVGATREPGEPPGDSSVWYNWTPQRAWTALASLERVSARLLNLEVYTGSSVGALTLVASSNDPMGATWNVLLGTIYRIRVYKNTRTIPFTLDWSLTPPG